MTTAIPKPSRRNVILAGFVALVTALGLGITTRARADATPVGPLPPGAVSMTQTSLGQLVAIALPHASRASGLSWRLARSYDSTVVKEVSEADVDANVIIVYKVIGRGDTSLVFALTRGDGSSRAIKSATHKIEAR